MIWLIHTTVCVAACCSVCCSVCCSACCSVCCSACCSVCCSACCSVCCSACCSACCSVCCSVCCSASSDTLHMSMQATSPPRRVLPPSVMAACVMSARGACVCYFGDTCKISLRWSLTPIFFLKRNIGSFRSNIGLFWRNVGLFWM